MKITRNDVARKANVSPSTVSLILNGKTNHFNPETVKNVKKIAKELGYSPNKIARALKTGKSNIVTLWCSGITSPYMGAVIKNIQKSLIPYKYDLIIKDIENIDRVQDEIYVDGIIAYDCLDYTEKYLDKTNSKIPIVSAGMSFSEKLDNVTFDFNNGFVDGYNSLVNLGCKNIAYFTPYLNEEEQRYILYKHRTKKHKFKEYIISFNEQGSYENIMDSLKNCHFLKELDGIYCYNDYNAIILMRCLHELGYKVPKDLKIISTDNMYLCDYSVPSLSSIAIPIEKVCETVVEFLINRINNPKIKIQKKVFSSTFIERESSK